MSVRDTRLADVRRLLKQAVELELSAGAVQRLKWFLYTLEHDNNVSLACRHFGIARSTFMRWWNRFDAADTSSLEEASRRPHAVRAPETDARTVSAIRELRMAHPTTGKVGIHAMLREIYGIEASVSTVGRVIARHKLFFAEKASHQQKRGDTETATGTERDTTAINTTQLTPASSSDNGEDPLSLLPLPPLPTS
ncbi:MAG TPA: helix-turn-helix domain-containing protein [Candidatus Peribacteria bacterium]|nr:helix-turn-helix domain-containing protein [Candidatus Peribacteria bacterium]